MDDELLNSETSIEDAIDAFMKSSPDEETLSEDNEAETEVEETEEEELTEDDSEVEETEEDGEEDAEEAPAAKVADDDAEVTISVEGQEHKVAVKDLKRLFGQEASLTQKSQALAAQRRVLEAQGLYLSKVLQDRYDAAKVKAEKYKDVDLFRASRELDPEEFDALRAAVENAKSELTAIEREGQEFVQRAQETRSRMLREQAKESLKEITAKIHDWSDDLYGRICTYAISQGMDADVIKEVIDPGAIVMMHKAMKFDESQAKKETITKKVVKAPKKVLKKSDSTDRVTSKLKTLRKEAMNSGDIDSIADLFLAASKE